MKKKGGREREKRGKKKVKRNFERGDGEKKREERERGT